MLCNTYDLDDKTTKLVILSHLKGKTQSWFYSRPENLESNSEELLDKLREMYDVRPNKFELRKQFEARIWKITESFSDYYHDKIVKANEISIADDELVDYIIEGIPNYQLRSHARMQNFSSTSQLMQAFKKISLRTDTKGFNKQFEKGGVETKTIRPKDDSQNTNVRENLRCFNCNKPGHVFKECKQPKRERGSCYECGGMDHQLKQCPKKGNKKEEKEKEVYNVDCLPEENEFIRSVA